MIDLFKFDISNHNDKEQLLNFANSYSKLKGYCLAAQFDLPVIEKGFLLSSYEKHIIDTISSQSSQNNIYLCRIDTPTGYTNPLPRGKNLYLEDLPELLKTAKQFNSEAILLCHKHPTIDLLGEYAPRYKTDGAAQIAVNVQKDIIVEFVGHGFDVGDLTRGKAVHKSVQIPWKERYTNPKDLFAMAKRNILYNFEVPREEYLVSRENRIAELCNILSDGKREDINSYIPIIEPTIDCFLFSRVYSLFVSNILSKDYSALGDTFSILLNIYAQKFCAFEIWQKTRSDTFC